MDNQIQKKIDEKWSKHANSSHKLKLRWWDSPFILRHINHLICGEYVDDRSQGLMNVIKKIMPSPLPLEKGIAVGCGTGKKEFKFIKDNIVKYFDLYELSEGMIEKGRRLAQELGIEDKIRFHHGDAFKASNLENQYDFVHWGDALHHMLDADKAVAWSNEVLKKGGLFFMDDYVGASRFQWSDKSLEIATKVRESFTGTKYLVNPYDSSKTIPTKVLKPTVEKMIELDPSEAADSENILNAVRKYFPNATIRMTGGVVYHMALSDMLNNFDESKEEDMIMLKLLMIIDENCADMNETHYAVAYAIKE